MATGNRLHPLDLATVSVLAVASLWAGLHLVGARWATGRVGSGFLRVVPVEVAAIVSDPEPVAIAERLVTGTFVAETSSGPVAVTITAVERAEDGVRLRVALPAVVDRQGRAFFEHCRLRVGEELRFGNDRVLVRATQLEVLGLEPPAR